MKSESPKRNEAYRQFGASRSFADADAELRDYWWPCTPAECMEALEQLRIRVYGVPEPRRS